MPGAQARESRAAREAAGGGRKEGRRMAGEEEEVRDQVSIQNEYLNHRRVGEKKKYPGTYPTHSK